MEEKVCEFCGEKLGPDGHCYNFSCINCDPLSQYYEEPTPRGLMVTIERPDGTCYEQEIEYHKGEKIDKAVKRAQKLLGEEYLIVSTSFLMY